MYKYFKHLKYKYIKYLDKNPDYCWANLTMWASGHKPFWSLFFKSHIYKTKFCEIDVTGCGYCGKCEFTIKQ